MCFESWLIVAGTLTTAMATGLIALYAIKAHKLTELLRQEYLQLQKQSNRKETETRFLIACLTAATLANGEHGGSPHDASNNLSRHLDLLEKLVTDHLEVADSSRSSV